MKVPLFLSPDDNTDEANLARIKLHMDAAAVTGGRGFRQPGKKSNPTRIERIAERSFA